MVPPSAEPPEPVARLPEQIDSFLDCGDCSAVVDVVVDARVVVVGEWVAPFATAPSFSAPTKFLEFQQY